MFGTDDLPIFSGTPMTDRSVPFVADTRAELEQLGFAFKCRFCRDTGRIGRTGRCWCTTQRAQRDADMNQRWAQMEAQR